MILRYHSNLWHQRKISLHQKLQITTDGIIEAYRSKGLPVVTGRNNIYKMVCNIVNRLQKFRKHEHLLQNKWETLFATFLNKEINVKCDSGCNEQQDMQPICEFDSERQHAIEPISKCNSMQLDVSLTISESAKSSSTDQNEKSDHSDYIPDMDFSDSKIPIPEAILKEFDSTDVGYRKLSKIIAATLAWADKNPDDYAISASYLNAKCRQLREKIRKENSLFIQQLTTKVSILHDGKYTKQLAAHHLPVEHRMATLAFSKGKAIPLATKVLKNKSAATIAEFLFETITDYKLEAKIVALVSDGENLNTGFKGGVTAHMENILKEPLLQIVCRRHIYETVFRGVFEAKFGKSTDKKPRDLEILKSHWELISNRRLEFNGCDEKWFSTVQKRKLRKRAIEVLMADRSRCQKENIRGDYREIIDLSLLVLGGRLPTDKKEYKFKVPGATIHARYMAKIIGTMKIFLFRNILKEVNAVDTDKIKNHTEVALFAALLYVPQWNKVANIIDAPFNDFMFLKDLERYQKIDRITAEAAFAKLTNNLYYLGGELVTLSLFSTKVSNQIKDRMRTFLIAHKEMSKRSTRHNRSN